MSTKPPTKPATKTTRKKLSIVEQKTKLELNKKKLAEQESKIKVAELKDYMINLKVDNVGSVFNVVKESKSGVTTMDVLRTLAEISGLKVLITEKLKVIRKPKVGAASK